MLSDRDANQVIDSDPRTQDMCKHNKITINHG